MKKQLTFEDGILLCKLIYQSAIDKILKGVIEEEQIFYKTHKMLNKLNIKLNNKRIDELLYILNIENIYSII
ncbi:MAG: hypothetical protein AYK22_07130 [Thermoplasmatales archaeon SG8-52-3]|nr:MAG: hypothetical protein AYK22_07130 [Thermoplasmatales archaeon SG8-52-3]